MSEKRKTMPFTTSSLWKIWSMQPYLGFPPSGLFFEVGRKGGKNSRPESLLRIRYPAKKLEDQATQTRKGGHRCYDIQHQGRNPKTENYRAAAHFY